MLVAESIDLKKQLEKITPKKCNLPAQYHARTGHHLPVEKSEVHGQLLQTIKYAEDNHMKLNLKKTKLMLFNPSKSLDFLPQFNIEGNDIELVDETRLLGITIRSDLSWSAHIDDLVKRCYKKLWILRRLKKLGADLHDLKEIYVTQIRSILEFAAPVWAGSITNQEIVQIERVQKNILCNFTREKVFILQKCSKRIELN